ncbi:MAG: RNA 2'-phosphotransferase [Theionarchaea archaeon]|nr:RNA 2'-phosphotransferase [Theionarchaea archaeon]
MEEKQKIRETIWKKMRTQEIERFPYAWGRIPNFEGAGKAAARLTKLREYREAPVIFVAPDTPQKPVRMQALRDGKTVVMPTPRLKSGFLVISPQKGKEKHAASIRGAFAHGKKVPVERIPPIAFVVQGAVAVDRGGNRVGKGGGYGDREIALLQKHEKISQAQIAVTVHDVQVVEFLPQDRWDFTVDIIVTPTRMLRTEATRQKAISKYMSYILRHHPPESISEDGFIVLDEFIELLQSRYTVSKEAVLSIVSCDTKGRFQIEGEKIRALYGHSYPVSIEFPCADVDVLYHGTSPEAARQILQEGLNSRDRQKVHLSPTPESAREVGYRHCNNPVILKINTQKALIQGIIIEKASKSVYVADHIPPEYITFYR